MSVKYYVIDEPSLKAVKAIMRMAYTLSDNQGDRDRYTAGMILLGCVKDADQWAADEGLGYCPDCEDRSQEPDRDESRD